MKNYLVLTIIALALFLQWYSHGSSLFITDDSNHYLAGRENLLNSLTLIDKDGHHYLFWPPLFPVILSFFESPAKDLIWLNALLTICIGAVSANILNRQFENIGIRYLCLTFILLSVHLLLISSYLWSELIFLFLLLIFVDQLLKIKENRIAFYIVLVSGFLMCLQRNVGISIAAGASLWILINEENWKNKIVKASILFLTVSSGLIIWNIYVWFFIPHDHFTFSDTLFQYSLLNASSVANAIIKIFVPINFLPIPILFIAFFVLVFAIRKDFKKDLSLQLIFILTVAYISFIGLVLIINVGGFPVDFGEADRFISVIVPFAGILFFKLIEKLLENKSAATKLIMLTLMCFWMCYPLARTINNAMLWHEKSKTNLVQKQVPKV